MCWQIRFSTIVHLHKAPITTSSGNVPDSHNSVYRSKYYNLFKQSVLSDFTRKKYTLILMLFNQKGKNGTIERTYKITTQKCWTGVTFGHFSTICFVLILSWFFISDIYIKGNNK